MVAAGAGGRRQQFARAPFHYRRWARRPTNGRTCPLATTAEDRQQARAILLDWLALRTDGRTVEQAAVRIATLDPTPDEIRQVRELLMMTEAPTDNELENWDSCPPSQRQNC
jgi:hypothetical protein